MKYDEEDSLYYARHLKYKAMEEGWGITEMIFEVPEAMFDPEKTTMYGIKVIKGRDDIPRLYVGYSPNGTHTAWEKAWENAKAQEVLKNKAIAEEAATDICNHYCKYPLIWDEDAEEVELSESEICKNCPMTKITKMFGGNK